MIPNCSVCGTPMAQMFFQNSFKCANLCDKQSTITTSAEVFYVLAGPTYSRDRHGPLKATSPDKLRQRSDSESINQAKAYNFDVWEAAYIGYNPTSGLYEYEPLRLIYPKAIP